jgi:hypothetical protein
MYTNHPPGGFHLEIAWPKMDPSLRKQKEAFKRRAIAATEKSKKSKEAISGKINDRPKKTKKAFENAAGK